MDPGDRRQRVRHRIFILALAPFALLLSPFVGGAGAARRLWADPQKRTLAFSAALVLVVVMFVFHFVDAWPYLDSLYFIVVSLLTIGFGDYVHTTDLGKVLTILYAITGVSIILGFVDAIARDRLERGYLARRGERKAKTADEPPT